MKFKLGLFWLLVFGLSFFLFQPTLKYYFFQDDFYLFRISQTSSLAELARQFIPQSGVTFYRPGSRLVFYNLLRRAFGYQAFFYHVFGLLLHFINATLIYSLVKKITKINPLALLVSFFYITAANHYMALAWVAAFHYLWGTLLALIGFHLFLKGVKTGRKNLLVFSFLFGLLGVLSEQIVVVLPLLICLYVFLFGKDPKKMFLKYKGYFLSLLSISGFYFIFRFFIVKIPLEETYKMVFDLRVLKNLSWHVLWSLNVPEDFKYQMISFFRINPQFVANFFEVNRRVWMLVVINLVLIYFLPWLKLINAFKEKKLNIDEFFRLSFFGLGWFLIGLLPIIFFPLHQYPYFLTIAGVGWLVFLLTPLGLLINHYRGRKKVVYGYVILVALSWYTASVINFKFTDSIHWIKSRQEVSKVFLKSIKEQFPNPEPGTTIILPGAKKILKHALMNDESMFVLYGNKPIHLGYADFEMPEECLLIKEERAEKIMMQASLVETNYLYQKYQGCLRENKIFFLGLSKVNQY